MCAPIHDEKCKQPLLTAVTRFSRLHMLAMAGFVLSRFKQQKIPLDDVASTLLKHFLFLFIANQTGRCGVCQLSSRLRHSANATPKYKVLLLLLIDRASCVSSTSLYIIATLIIKAVFFL